MQAPLFEVSFAFFVLEQALVIELGYFVEQFLPARRYGGPVRRQGFAFVFLCRLPM